MSKIGNSNGGTEEGRSSMKRHGFKKRRKGKLGQSGYGDFNVSRGGTEMQLTGNGKFRGGSTRNGDEKGS